jgi:hypothetical protein
VWAFTEQTDDVRSQYDAAEQQTPQRPEAGHDETAKEFQP